MELSCKGFEGLLVSVTTQLHLLLLSVAGWINHHQQAVVEYHQEENRILLEQLGGKPRRFTDAQRAPGAKSLGARSNPVARSGEPRVTPGTLLRWFRRLVAQKWPFAKPHPLGRPAVATELDKLVIKLIQDNPTWGSNRIVGALANLGHTLSDVTIDKIRRRNGFDPAPIGGKNSNGRQFLKAHLETLLAADFFTTEVFSWRGLTTY